MKKQKLSKAEQWKEFKNQRYQLTAIPNSWFKEADQPTAQEETYILRPAEALTIKALLSDMKERN